MEIAWIREERVSETISSHLMLPLQPSPPPPFLSFPFFGSEQILKNDENRYGDRYCWGMAKGLFGLPTLIHFCMYFGRTDWFFSNIAHPFFLALLHSMFCLLSQSWFNVAGIRIVYSSMVLRILVNLRRIYRCSTRYLFVMIISLEII